MNAAARLIHSSSTYQHVTLLIQQVHWLKAPQQTDFKLAVLADKCLHRLATVHLTDELQQALKLVSRVSSLTVHCIQFSTVSHWAVLGACTWNSLPQHVTLSPSSLPVLSTSPQHPLYQSSAPHLSILSTSPQHLTSAFSLPVLIMSPRSLWHPLYQSSASYLGILSTSPQHVISASSLPVFRACLKTFLLSLSFPYCCKCPYSDSCANGQSIPLQHSSLCVL